MNLLIYIFLVGIGFGIGYLLGNKKSAKAVRDAAKDLRSSTDELQDAVDKNK